MAELDITEREILATNLVTMPLLDQTESVEGYWTLSSPTTHNLESDGIKFANGAGGMGAFHSALGTVISDDLAEYEGMTLHVELNITTHTERSAGQGLAIYATELAEPPSGRVDPPYGVYTEVAQGFASITSSYDLAEQELTGENPLYLIITPTDPSRVARSPEPTVTLHSIRAYFTDGEGDDYGLFTGDTVGDEEIEYAWLDAVNESRSYALAAAVEEPDPGDGGDNGDGGDGPGQDQYSDTVLRMAARVLKLSNKSVTPARVALAAEHVTLVMTYVHGYTRARGFTQDLQRPLVPEFALEQVIVSSAARLTNNPTQVSYYVAGDYTERPAVLAGWTLPELAVLNNYRRRWA